MLITPPRVKICPGPLLEVGTALDSINVSPMAWSSTAFQSAPVFCQFSKGVLEGSKAR